MDWQRPVLMGVVNVTPDSFSDGGRSTTTRARSRTARRLAAEGAAILDVGGESTRPGADPVPADEELRRVIPVRRGPRRRRPVLSIDTMKLAVADAALDAGRRLRQRRHRLPPRPGAGRRSSPTRGVDCCLMHMLGEPRTMQHDPRYDDVVSDVKAFLEERLAFAVGAGRARGAHPARPRDRLRQDARAQPRAARAGSTSSSRSAARW